ncbi:DUF6249 domain-containing protein [Porticoccaceae bacterium]|jgi:hypothetical protein|nr:DUF6249 domain-containing protein [Porticoccaceae bacterium]MDB2565804.1 DUF6249 domain-containing protein [Porticoccaceae bacterium]MDB2621041.1 DUF6249 domain-containing protein [Porticoccaceae bacterium]
MTSFVDAIVPIFAIFAVFGMPAVIVWTALHFNNKKKEQFHTSLQKLIASGQELTPELMQSIPGYQEEKPKDSDVKGGAVLIGIGIGIVLLGYFGMHNSVVWGSGLLVACLGLGLLGAGIYSERDSSEDA